jgi:hypothetical protein
MYYIIEDHVINRYDGRIATKSNDFIVLLNGTHIETSPVLKIYPLKNPIHILLLQDISKLLKIIYAEVFDNQRQLQIISTIDVIRLVITITDKRIYMNSTDTSHSHKLAYAAKSTGVQHTINLIEYDKQILEQSIQKIIPTYQPKQ